LLPDGFAARKKFTSKNCLAGKYFCKRKASYQGETCAAGKERDRKLAAAVMLRLEEFGFETCFIASRAAARVERYSLACSECYGARSI
jgi:hypothetical protein